MALFKIFGNFASGNTTLPTTYTQGYCYFDKNTGKFWVDTTNAAAGRMALNAEKADKDSDGNVFSATYVKGPASATDGAIATYNGTGGKTIQNSAKTITTSAPTSSATDSTIPTSKAVWSAISSNDTKVTQTAITATTSADYRILLSGSTNDTTETKGANKNTNLRFNTGTKTLSVGGSIDATGNLSVTGNTTLSGATSATNLTAGSLVVTGPASFAQSPTVPTPAVTSNDTTVATTEFVNNIFSNTIENSIDTKMFNAFSLNCDTERVENGTRILNKIGANKACIQFGYYYDSSEDICRLYYGFTLSKNSTIKTIKLYRIGVITPATEEELTLETHSSSASEISINNTESYCGRINIGTMSTRGTVDMRFCAIGYDANNNEIEKIYSAQYRYTYTNGNVTRTRYKTAATSEEHLIDIGLIKNSNAAAEKIGCPVHNETNTAYLSLINTNEPVGFNFIIPDNMFDDAPFGYRINILAGDWSQYEGPNVYKAKANGVNDVTYTVADGSIAKVAGSTTTKVAADVPGYDPATETITTLVDNVTVSGFYLDDDSDGNYGTQLYRSADNAITGFTTTSQFALNTRYLITWDGVEYSCYSTYYQNTKLANEKLTATLAQGTWSTRVLGDSTLLGFPTIETQTLPFVFTERYDRSPRVIIVWTNSTETSHTITIKKITRTYKTVSYEEIPPQLKDADGKLIVREGKAENSLILNDGAVASGEFALAANVGTVAKGEYSTALGFGSLTQGHSTLAGGVQGQAIGAASVALGYGAIANGNISMSLGSYTVANGRASTVIGAFNEIDESDTANYSSYGTGARKYLFIVGNGTSASARSNAATIDWSGNVNAQNSLGVADAVQMVYNATTQALDFVFA